MIIPVRCFTCGAVVADKYEEYSKKIGKGMGAAKALDEVGVKRYCCRRMLLSHVDLVDEVLRYERL